MIPAGSTFRAVIAGSYGAFQGIGAGSAITTSLNGNGITVSSYVDDEPGLVNQVLQGDWFSRPYQVTIDGSVSIDFQSPQHLASVVTAAFWQALGAAPSATAVTLVNGIPTGDVATPPPVYPLDQIAALPGQVLKPAFDTATLWIVIAVIGVVVLIGFGPQTAKSGKVIRSFV